MDLYSVPSPITQVAHTINLDRNSIFYPGGGASNYQKKIASIFCGKEHVLQKYGLQVDQMNSTNLPATMIAQGENFGVPVIYRPGGARELVFFTREHEVNFPENTKSSYVSVPKIHCLLHESSPTQFAVLVNRTWNYIHMFREKPSFFSGDHRACGAIQMESRDTMPVFRKTGTHNTLFFKNHGSYDCKLENYPMESHSHLPGTLNYYSHTPVVDCNTEFKYLTAKSDNIQKIWVLHGDYTREKNFYFTGGVQITFSIQNGPLDEMDVHAISQII